MSEVPLVPSSPNTLKKKIRSGSNLGAVNLYSLFNIFCESLELDCDNKTFYMVELMTNVRLILPIAAL